MRRIAALALASGAAIAAHRSSGAGGSIPDEGAIGVVAAARDLDPGEVIADEDLLVVALPVAAVPPGRAADPVGSVVASPILTGEVILSARLGSGHRLGLAPDERAVALLPPLAPLPLAVGDVVDLTAVVAGVDGRAAAERLGSGRVVALDERAITVAVPAGAVPLVLERQATGSVEIALTPWGS